MIFRRVLQYLMLVMLAGFLALFLLMPLFTVIGEGCSWQLICEVFRSPVYVEGLANSFAISLVTTAMVAVISLFLALLYDRYDFAGKEYCSLLMLLPMILPPFVGALGFQQILGHYGALRHLYKRLFACYARGKSHRRKELRHEICHRPRFSHPLPAFHLRR